MSGFLRWSLGHRWKAWVGIFLIITSGAVAFSQVDKEFFPESLDRDLFMRLNLDRKYTLDQIRPAIDSIETYLYQNQEALEIRDVYSYFDEDGNAQLSILLTEAKDAVRSATDIRDEIMENMPKIAIGRPAIDSDRLGGAEGVTVMLVGESSEVLRELSESVIFAMREIEGLVDVKSEIGVGDNEVMVQVDRERAIQYGFSAQQVATAVAVAVRGTQLSEYRDTEGEVPLTLRFAESETRTINQLAGAQIAGKQRREYSPFSLGQPTPTDGSARDNPG